MGGGESKEEQRLREKNEELVREKKALETKLEEKGVDSLISGMQHHAQLNAEYAKQEQLMQRLNDETQKNRDQTEQMKKQMEEKEKNLREEQNVFRTEKDKFESLTINRYVRVLTEKIKEQQAMAAKHYPIDLINDINIALIGQTGSGKSTSINAIRYLNDFDAESAKVDVTETTASVKAYRHPIFTQFVFWDFPGAGTIKHPVLTYFQDKMLCVFDVLIVIYDNRFQEADLDLVKIGVNAYDIPIVIARNKANNDFRGYQKQPEQRNLDKDQIKKNLINKLRSGAQAELSLAKISPEKWPPIFIINPLSLKDLTEEPFEEQEFMKFVFEKVTSKRLVPEA